jgi:hypothetical protein
MKQFPLWMSLFLLAGSAWALDSMTPIDLENPLPSVSAKAECSTFNPESNKNACYKLITPDSTFDEHAVGICDRMNDSGKALECMSMLQHGKFEDLFALQACAHAEDADDAMECLGAIKNKHTDMLASQVCTYIHAADDIIDCIEAIAGKKYTRNEIDKCSSQPSDQTKIGCFEDSGDDGGEGKRLQEEQRKWDDEVKAKGQPQPQFQTQLHSLSGLKPATLPKGTFLRMITQHAGETLKCTPQKQGGNGELEKFITNAQMTVESCVWVKKK